MTKKTIWNQSMTPLWLAISGISLLILLGAYQYYQYEKKHIEKEKFSDIKAISDLKVNQIVQWLDERLSEVKFFSGSSDFIENTYNLQNQTSAVSQNYFREKLSHIQNEHAYQNLLIVTGSGEVVFQMNEEEPLIEAPLKKAIAASFNTDSIAFTGFYLTEEGRYVQMEIVAPIIRNNLTIAVLVFRIDPESYLYPLLQNWPTASKSSETLIVRDNGDSVLFLNELRHQKKSALKLSVPKSDTTIPAVAAVRGYEGIFDGIDYRGVKVLSYVRPIPGWPWYMIAKVDKQELFAELRFKTTAIIIVVVILFLTVAAAGALLYNQRRKEIYKGLYLKEKELWESQEEFKTTLYSIGDAVITTDVNGHIKQMNPAAEELTGWQEDEAKGLHHTQIFKIVREGGNDDFEDPVKRIVQKGEPITLENHALMLTKNGQRTPIADSGAPIRNNEGRITGTVLVFKNQIREREIQKQVRDSEEKFRLIAEKASDVIWTYDLKKKRYTYVSPSIENIFGFTPGEALNMNIEDHIPLDYKEQVTQILNPANKGNSGPQAPLLIEMEQLKKNGARVWTAVSLTILYDKNDEPTILHGITRDITERKKAEQALANSEEKYRLLTENSVDVVWQTDLQFKFTYVSPSVRILLGYRQEEMIGTYVKDHFGRNEFSRMGKNIMPLLSSDKKTKVAVVEGRMKCKNGHIRWVEVVSKPLRDKTGKLIGLQGSTRDINQRIEAEKKLKENEELLHRSQEIAKVGSWDFNLADNRLIWSDEVYRIFGLDPGKFKPDYQTFLDRIHPDDRERVDKAYNSSLENNEDGYAIEHRIIQRNSSKMRYVYEKCEHIRNREGKIIRSVGMVQDITERIEYEKALRQSEARFRRLFESAPVGIFKTDSSGVVYEMNPTMARMLDCESVEEAIDYYQDIGSKLYIDPKKRNEFIDLLKRDGYVENFEIEATTKTNQNIHLSMSARVSEWNMDSSFVIDGFTTDITAQKEAAEKLLEQNKEYQILNEEYISQNNELSKSIELIRRVNRDLEIAREKAEESDRLKTSFLANMSHEIRTPMNAIIGFSNFLNDNITEEEKKRFIRIIQINAGHLMKIIDDVISISRLESENIRPEKHTFLLKNLLEALYHSFLPDFEERQITLEYKLPPNLADVKIQSDYQKIHQILSGFINNSLKYTPHGKILFGCELINAHIRFYVKDTGLGIPEDEQDKVFDRFFRGREAQKKAIGGTGLGLSIASYLTRLIHGEIELQSKVGEGSTFAIKIPFIPAEETDEDIRLPEADITGMNDLKVLIVEDEPANQEYINILLSNTVKKIEMASNGQEALEFIEKESFDLVLMDIKMPVMDGLQATRSIRKNNRNIIIIAQTAYSQPEEINKAIEAGCNDYLIKPIRKEDLFRTIRKYIRTP